MGRLALFLFGDTLPPLEYDMRLSLALAATLLAACADDELSVDVADLEVIPADEADLPDDLELDPTIFYGSSPNAPRHDAVVSLHTIQGRYVYADPFCSGTLITPNTIMTAAHCVDTASPRATAFRTMAAGTLGIYVGNNPNRDITSHLYTVRGIRIYSGYDRRAIRNDIALIRLTANVTEATPVPHLPAAQGLTNADFGDDLNIAGFGLTERGTAGIKLQADSEILGFGCASRYCSGRGDSATQVSYTQSSGGPCSGDSGGPAFIQRGNTWYVAGVTSYGDYNCDYYGASTRVDAFTTWINSTIAIR